MYLKYNFNRNLYNTGSPPSYPCKHVQKFDREDFPSLKLNERSSQTFSSARESCVNHLIYLANETLKCLFDNLN